VKKTILLLLAALLMSATTVTRAADEHAYTEGPVLLVSFVRTEPGMFEDYMRYLSKTYKHVMEEFKKQGIVVDYAIYQTRPRDAQDADVILTVTYRNMAALDDLQSRTDPVIREVFGSLSQAASSSADRGKLRKEVGSQLVRQLILK
jgi:L-rhamnose mutarotase